VAPNNI